MPLIHFRTNVSRERVVYNYLIKSKRVITRVNNFDIVDRNVEEQFRIYFLYFVYFYNVALNRYIDKSLFDLQAFLLLL